MIEKKKEGEKVNKNGEWKEEDEEEWEVMEKRVKENKRMPSRGWGRSEKERVNKDKNEREWERVREIKNKNQTKEQEVENKKN